MPVAQPWHGALRAHFEIRNGEYGMKKSDGTVAVPPGCRVPFLETCMRFSYSMAAQREKTFPAVSRSGGRNFQASCRS